MEPGARVKIELEEYQGGGYLVRRATADEKDDRDFWVVVTDSNEVMTLLPDEFEVVGGRDLAIRYGLRPCRAIRYEKGEAIEVYGRFHRWGSQYEEFENGPANFTTALVEAEDGKVYECIADGLQFLDRDPDTGERR